MSKQPYTDPHPMGIQVTRHRIRYLVLALLVIFGLLMTAEAVWWTNGKQSYPRALITAAPSGADSLMALRDACGDSIEVAADGLDRALVRCGSFWPARSVWSVPKAYVSPAIR